MFIGFLAAFFIVSSVKLNKIYFILYYGFLIFSVYSNILIVLKLKTCFSERQKKIASRYFLTLFCGLFVFTAASIQSANVYFDLEKGFYEAYLKAFFTGIYFSVLYITLMFEIFLSVLKIKKEKYKTTFLSSALLLFSIISVHLYLTFRNWKFLLIFFMFQFFYLASILYLYYDIQNKYLKVAEKITLLMTCFIYLSLIFGIFVIKKYSVKNINIYIDTIKNAPKSSYNSNHTYKGIDCLATTQNKEKYGYILYKKENPAPFMKDAEIYFQKTTSGVDSIFLIRENEHKGEKYRFTISYKDLRKIIHGVYINYVIIFVLFMIGLCLIYIPVIFFMFEKKLSIFIKSKKEVAKKNNYNIQINITSKDEFLFLANSFNNMIYNIRHNVVMTEQNAQILENYRALRSENIKFEKEIKTALEAYKKMRSSFPKLENVKISIIEKPFTSFSGNIFDLTKINNNIFRIFLASVPGCDIQAALISTIVRSEYENMKQNILSPSEIFERINEIITEDHKQTTIFFTGIILDIDLKNKKLTYSSARHPCQYMIFGETIVPFPTTQNTVGISKDYKAFNKTIEIQNHMKLILFTCGLFEIYDKKDKYFGEERIYEIIDENKLKSEEEIIKILLKKTNDFSLSIRTSDVSIIGMGMETI